MDDTERLSALIGDIYDSALDPSLWPGALENAARFVGGPAASVFSKDATRKSAQIFFQYGIDPSYEQLYIDKYVKLDPSTTSQFFANVGDIISTENFTAYDQFLETRFFKEWACPQLLVDSANTVLQKSGRQRILGFPKARRRGARSHSYLIQSPTKATGSLHYGSRRNVKG